MYDNLAFGLFKPFMKMIRFCSTNNSSKKKWKNTSLLLYKYAHIKITLLSKDNSWYSLILTLDLSLMSEAGIDILLQGLRKHATSLQILST